ncbi:endonuclease reverse, partial [Colletotrichum incanum]
LITIRSRLSRTFSSQDNAKLKEEINKLLNLHRTQRVRPKSPRVSLTYSLEPAAPSSSYATVASQLITRKQDKLTSAKQAANRAALKDLRIFARLPPKSPLRNERAYDIYIFVQEKLTLKGIDYVKTGLALLLSLADRAKVLLDNGEQIPALL